MKKPVMRREMFIAMAPKSGSKGIMSGFDDEMEIEDYEDRTPENLEIIANNLRGDIRSMDERYLELAQMVGESAFETPEEVIALMQSQMGQQQPPQGPAPAPAQQPGGIAALGGATAPQAPQGIMQGVAGPVDQGPMEQPPVQMAHGGIVHRQLGSPPTGEVAPGRRSLGFMRFMEPGSFPDPRTMDPRSMPIPKVQVQQTPLMAPSYAGNAIRYGDMSPQAAQFLQSGAARPGTLPQQIPLATRLSTNVYEAMRNAPGFAREASRTLMATPIGKGAAVVGSGLGLLGVDQAYRNLVSPQGPASSGQPAVSEVPGVDAQGRYTPVPLPTPVRGKTGDVATDIGELPMRGKTGIPGVDVGGEEPAAPVVPVPTTTVPAPAKVTEKAEVAAPKPRDFKGRVEDKIAIYKDVLGDDKNMRQAQALFLLAEAALNVAGAPGRSTAERLAKGLKGLPAGMGALGAEQAKQDLAIRSAAVSSVEQEMAAESKQATQLMLKMADLQAKNADINTIAQYLVDSANFSPEKALEVAKLKKADALKGNDAGELLDFTGRVLRSPFRLVEGDIGFLPTDKPTPFVEVGKRSLVPASAKDRSSLITEMNNNQSLIKEIETVMQLPEIESMVGPLARIQSGATTLLTPFLGDSIPFTNLSKQVQENVARQAHNTLLKLNVRNESKPSVWDQQQVNKQLPDYQAILSSPTKYLGLLNNYRIQAINRANEINHMLNGGPLAEMRNIPLGTEQDPLKAKDAEYLGEFFRLRPNGSLYIEIQDPQNPNKTKKYKYTAQEYFKQIGQQ
jgi:hypothetical protein